MSPNQITLVRMCTIEHNENGSIKRRTFSNKWNLVNLGSPQCIATHFFYKTVVCVCGLVVMCAYFRCARVMGMFFPLFLEKIRSSYKQKLEVQNILQKKCLYVKFTCQKCVLGVGVSQHDKFK